MTTMGSRVVTGDMRRAWAKRTIGREPVGGAEVALGAALAVIRGYGPEGCSTHEVAKVCGLNWKRARAAGLALKHAGLVARANGSRWVTVVEMDVETAQGMFESAVREYARQMGSAL